MRWLREKLSQFETIPLRITTVTRAGYRLDRLDGREMVGAASMKLLNLAQAQDSALLTSCFQVAPPLSSQVVSS